MNLYSDCCAFENNSTVVQLQSNQTSRKEESSEEQGEKNEIK